MNSKLLRNFAELVESENMTAASHKLFIAQPVLSNQLRALENLAVEEARDCELGEHGTLRLGMTSSTAITLFDGILTRFCRMWPQIRYQLYEMNSVKLLQLLKTGAIDVAVARTPCHFSAGMEPRFISGEQLYAVSFLDKSLFCMDSLTFIIDFLNSDDQEVSSPDYPFQENESGVFVLDFLNLENSRSRMVYDRFGCGFASYNGSTDLADYVLIDHGGGKYEAEFRIALSDSVKQRLSAATEDCRPEIGFSIILQDDKNCNGVYEYEEGLDECQLVENVSVNSVWHNLVMVRTDDGHLQPVTCDSPRWLSTLVLAAG